MSKQIIVKSMGSELFLRSFWKKIRLEIQQET